MNEKWNASPSMETGFWNIVSQSGRVIALRIPDEKTARQICFEHNDYFHMLELLDTAGIWTGADDFASDRVSMLIELEKGKRATP